jgi:hypothetical protein
MKRHGHLYAAIAPEILRSCDLAIDISRGMGGNFCDGVRTFEHLDYRSASCIYIYSFAKGKA